MAWLRYLSARLVGGGMPQPPPVELVPLEFEATEEAEELDDEPPPKAWLRKELSDCRCDSVVSMLVNSAVRAACCVATSCCCMEISLPTSARVPCRPAIVTGMIPLGASDEVAAMWARPCPMPGAYVTLPNAVDEEIPGVVTCRTSPFELSPLLNELRNSPAPTAARPLMVPATSVPVYVEPPEVKPSWSGPDVATPKVAVEP